MMSFCRRYWFTKATLSSRSRLSIIVDELVPVLLAVVAQQLGVGLSGDQVERVGVPLHDPRHRLDHVLEALAGSDQAERRHDLTPAEAQLLLQTPPAARLDVRHAVLDHGRRGRDAVHLAQDVDGGLGHHDQVVGVGGDVAHRVADRLGGLGQHGVHRHDDGLADLLQERGEVVDVGALDPACRPPRPRPSRGRRDRTRAARRRRRRRSRRSRARRPRSRPASPGRMRHRTSGP